MKLLAIDSLGKSFSIDIDLSRKLGEGATATVFRVVLQKEILAAKLYKPDRDFSREKLEAMLASPPAELEVTEGNQTFIRFTWIKYLLKDKAGKVVGFLMPFVDQMSTNSLDTYYDPVLIKRLPGNTPSALSLRLEIAHNLCSLISELHAIGHHFIDIKPQNIRVYKDNNKVVLMDCDGYSIKNHHPPPERFPADLISTDFIAPEVLRNHLSPKSLGEEQDRYGLAVILFQLLNLGTHPFQGIVTDHSIQVSTNDERAALWLYPHGLLPNPSVKPRPQSVHDLLLTETRAIFDQAFTSLIRPSAKEWGDHFNWVLENKLLVRCKNFPSDVRHIHFKDYGCIGCKVDKVKLLAKNNKTSTKNYTSPPADSGQNSQNTAQSASAYRSHYSNTPATPPKSSEIKWELLISVVGLIVILMIFLGNYSNNAAPPAVTPSGPIASSAPDPSQSTVEGSCEKLSISTLPVADICKYYWTNFQKSCDPLFENELRRRGVSIYPSGACGLPANSNSNTAPVQTSKFISVYVSSETRSVGYSLDNPNTDTANKNAKIQCESQTTDKNADLCQKLVSGEGKCVAISRASNGAMGVQIGANTTSLATNAQSACRNSGGEDCPHPSQTTFCSK